VLLFFETGFILIAAFKKSPVNVSRQDRSEIISTAEEISKVYQALNLAHEAFFR
jgi:hypothetical protein